MKWYWKILIAVAILGLLYIAWSMYIDKAVGSLRMIG